MSIEFYCTACEAYLRAPDAKAGLSISCPHCHSRLWVPHHSEELVSVQNSENWHEGKGLAENDYDTESQFSESDGVADSKPSSEINCLRCQASIGPDETLCGECGFHQFEAAFNEVSDVDVGKILATTWQIFVKNFWSCFSVTLMDTLLTILATIITLFIAIFSASMAARMPGIAFIVFMIVAALGWGVAMSMFAVGHLRFYLDLCRTENPDFRKSVNFEGPVGSMLIGGIVYWSLFPMIFPAILLWPFGRVVVDQQTSAIGGLKTALRLTSKNAGVCFVLLIVKIGIILMSGLLPVIGMILLTPYLAILNSVAYLYFIGEFE